MDGHLNGSRVSHFAPILIVPFLWATPARAEEARFVPENCFPADSLAYISIASVGGLEKALLSTPIGHIMSHPGFRAALGKLPDLLRAKILEGTADFTEMAGMGLLEALSLPRGEVAAAIVPPGPEGFPRIAVAVELGPSREKILGLFEHIDNRLRASMGGGELPTIEAGKNKAVCWPLGGPTIGRTVLGTHLVLAFPADLLPSIASLHDGEAGAGEGAEKKAGSPGRSLKDAPFFASLKPRLEVTDRQILVAADVDRARALALAANQGENRSQVEMLFKVTGLDGVGGLGYALGFERGDFESRIHLFTKGEPTGLMKALADSLQPFGGLDEAFQRIPAGASSLFSARIQPGKLIADSLSIVKADLPWTAETLDGAVRGLEEKLGISLEKDIAPLPPIGIVAFSIQPPAGSLVDDSVLLLRSSEFEPYEKVIAKLTSSAGGPRAHEEGGKKISYFPFGAYVPLDGGWTACSGTVQALRRLVTHYSAAPKVAGAPDLLKECRERLGGSGAALVIRNARQLLLGYNTLVTLANFIAPSLDEYLSPLGVDLGLLPPGEEFLGEIRDGFLQLRLEKDGLSLHTRGLLTSSGLLPAAAAAGVIAGFTVPTLTKARGRAEIVKCQSNLREIMKLGMIYADTGSNRFYPYSPGGGIASLQVLVDANEGLKPTLFICNSSGEMPAEVDEKGKFKLDAGHCSYEMVPWRLSPSNPADSILAFDRTPCHEGKRNVVYIDGSVEFVEEAKFQEALATQRKSMEKREAAEKARKKEAAPAQPKKRQKKVDKEL